MKKILILFILFTAFAISLKSQTLTQANFTGTIVPKFMGSGTSTRLPLVFRAQISSLQANTTYRYYTQAGISTDIGGSNSGAGNPMLISQSGSTFTYTTGPGLSSTGNYETFMTDGSGNYSGWFCFVNTGNARFTAGNYIIPTITIDSAGSGTTKYRFALNDSIKVLAFATTSGANNGTGIYGISNGIPKNIVALYDNTAGTGKPLSVTYLESEGTSVPSTVNYYTDSVDTRSGRWGAIIPNDNANGVKRIEQFSAASGTSMNFNTDADGTWPSGANTVNPSGGSTTPIRITIIDAPLAIDMISTIVPDKFNLYQNYPNPFNPSTKIKFEIPKAGFVTLKLYDILGREIKLLASEKLTAGTYEYTLNASNMASGIYFYELQTENFTDVKKLTLIK